MYEDDFYDDDSMDDEFHGDDDRSEFANPGGNSALRAATRDNPRDQPCPTCGAEDVLTREDVARHYQCDSCADRDEFDGGGYGAYGTSNY